MASLWLAVGIFNDVYAMKGDADAQIPRYK